MEDKIFAQRIAEMLHKLEKLSPENIANALLKSGLVSDARARQYCATAEFYDQLSGSRRGALTEKLAEKYKISPRTLVSVINERRFRY